MFRSGSNRKAPRGVRALVASLAAAATLLSMSGCTAVQHVLDSQQAADPASVDVSNVPENLRGYYQQQVNWSDCGGGRECATITAPMNWDDPMMGDIELAATRIPASGDRQGSLFTNPGGPGASGYDFVYNSGEDSFSSDLRSAFDIVGWDPRGVGRSSAVECYDDSGMDEYFYGVPEKMPKTDDEKIAHAEEQAKTFADACKENTGELLNYVDTMSTVHDLDLLRAVVGDAKLNYFGFSYGTDIGAHYADTFPENVGRIVLDGATDPSLGQFDVVLAQQGAFGKAAEAYLEDCLSQAKKCPFRGNVDQATKQINRIMEDADKRKILASDGRQLSSGVISTAINAALYDESSWEYLTQAFSDYMLQGNPDTFFLLSDFYYGRDETGHYDSNMFEAFMAINCLDYPVETDPAKIKEYNKKLKEATPIGVDSPEALGDVQCQQWPYQSRVQPAKVTAAGAQPILVVGTTGDPATPVEWAEAVAAQLESGVLLTYNGEGHIAYDEGDKCVVGAVDEYLTTGTPPANGTVCG